MDAESAAYNPASAKKQLERALESWKQGARKAKPKLRAPGNWGHQYPGNIFNGMIYPVRPYGIRGAIWYQGERNPKVVGKATVTAVNDNPCIIAVKNPKAWSPERPFLYDLVFEVLGDKSKVLDTVKSYVGIRKIHTEGNRILLNNKPIYLRLVLDQGFYPDGIWTAPSDAALKRDIELSMKAGFNGRPFASKSF